MPVTFTLHVISAQDVDAPPARVLPTLTLGSARASIESWISRASNGELGFTMKHHTSSQRRSDGVNAATLQIMFNEIVPSPPAGEVARDIGLILCRDWVARGTLNGLMFDYDGDDPFLGTTFQSGGTPRQACAIFLDPLAGDGDEVVSRVALHELGHVFNLVHDRNGASFMATPSPGTGYKDRDATALERAGAGIPPDDKTHLPGLSNFDPSQSTLLRAPPFARRRASRGRDAAPGPLKLSVVLAKDRYLLGEIVTLEVRLSAKRGKSRVPCQIDPGYDAFQIWYETPLGERRLYRPFVRMCPSRSGKSLVTARDPLVNNPRVSVGNRGIVFRWPGHYRIWAELGLPASARPLVSNAVEFDVYGPRRDSERELCAALTRPDTARFLAQKGGVLGSAPRRRLGEAVNNHPRHEATKHMRYALAHQLLRARNRNGARELLVGLKFRLPSLQEGLERLRTAVGQRS